MKRNVFLFASTTARTAFKSSDGLHHTCQRAKEKKPTGSRDRECLDRALDLRVALLIFFVKLRTTRPNVIDPLASDSDTSIFSFCFAVMLYFIFLRIPSHL